MYETHLTAVGTLITAVDKRRFADGTTKVHFRIACNERRFDRIQNTWTDGDTLYMSVNCWRELADNVHASFVVGDPIIVRGRLLTREWEKEGKRNSITELEATAVGPDLSRCTTKITRTKRGGSNALDGGAGEVVGVLGEPETGRGAGASTGALTEPALTAGGGSLVGASEDDPWQVSRIEGVVAASADGGYVVDGWTEEPASGDRGATVEAAVGS